MNNGTKQCPFCGEQININAKKCRFCGEWLDKAESEEPKTINCPFCGEEILSTDEKCKFCGELLDDENSTQNISKKNKKDTLLNISAMPNAMMIIFSCLMWGLFQPGWLLSRANYQTKKSNKYSTCEYLSQIGACIPIQLPIILTLLNIIAGFICKLRPEEFGVLCFIVLCINSLILSIVEIKCANKIENYIFKQYGLFLRLNKVLIFFLQSIYLNYFFLTYQDRLKKARKAW